MDHFKMEEVQNSSDFESAREIRKTVFVLEQGIPAELEYDEDDARALHILCRQADTSRAVATGRLIINENQCGTLSRIAVLKAYRGKGIGKEVVVTLEQKARERGVLYLSLQPHYYLEGFYGNLGYKKIPGRESGVAGHPLITMEKYL